MKELSNKELLEIYKTCKEYLETLKTHKEEEETND